MKRRIKLIFVCIKNIDKNRCFVIMTTSGCHGLTLKNALENWGLGMEKWVRIESGVRIPHSPS